MQTLCKNEAWDLVPTSPHKKAIRCIWILNKVKYNVDGSVNRYKARLVANGYAQTIVRTVIALAAAKGWHLYQMDVKNAFLKGELEEEVHMVQPPDFNSSTHPKEICGLKKPLYGIKQAPHAWHSKIT